MFYTMSKAWDGGCDFIRENSFWEDSIVMTYRRLQTKQ